MLVYVISCECQSDYTYFVMDVRAHAISSALFLIDGRRFIGKDVLLNIVYHYILSVKVYYSR